MPKIFELDGFRFFFCSKEHDPIHIHVRYQGGEAVFELIDMVELRDSHAIKLHDLRRAQEIDEQNK